MKKIIFASMTVLSLIALSYVSYAHSGTQEGNAKFSKHFNETLFALGENGQVSIEVLLDEKEYKIGKGVIGIVIHDSHDEDVDDAKVIVTVTGIEAPLKIREKGGGLYLVPGAGLPQEGTWKLSISVKKKKIEDRAVFAFPEVLNKKIPAGKYNAETLKEQR